MSLPQTPGLYIVEIWAAEWSVGRYQELGARLILLPNAYATGKCLFVLIDALILCVWSQNVLRHTVYTVTKTKTKQLVPLSDQMKGSE